MDITSFSQMQSYPTSAWPSRPCTGEQPSQPNSASIARQQPYPTAGDNSSMLEAETRYLPLSSDLSTTKPYQTPPTARPRTAPPVAEQNGGISGTTGSGPIVINKSGHTRSTSNNSPGSGSGNMSKYDMLENRPIRPVQNRMSGGYLSVSPKISPKAGTGVGNNSEPVGRPTPSDNTPKPHQRKRSASPVTRAITFTEDSDTDTKSQTADLRAFKMLLAGKKSGGAAAAPVLKAASKPIDVPLTASPHAGSSTRLSPQQQQYTPEKYSTPTRKALANQIAAAQEAAQLKDTSSLSATSLGPASTATSLAHSPVSTYSHFNQPPPSLQQLQQYGTSYPYNTHAQDDVRDRSHRGAYNQPNFEDSRQFKGTEYSSYAEACVIRIQAHWRGYNARQTDPRVLRTRIHLNAQRNQSHIQNLQAELERHKELYEKEKCLRAAQLETLRYLIKEVQSLQQFKGQILDELEQRGMLGAERGVLDGGVGVVNQNGAEFLRTSHSQLTQSLLRASLDREAGFNLKPHSSELSPHPTLSSALLHAGRGAHSSQHAISGSTNKELELENMCKSLQKQVSELQQVLTSVSQQVFQGEATLSEKPDGEDVRVSADFEEGKLDQNPPPPPPPPPGTFKSTSSSSSTNKKSVNIIPGLPTPPRNLCTQENNSKGLVLHWLASHNTDKHGQPTQAPIKGYRIWINDNPKGKVAGKETKALIEGLSTKNTYRVSVCAFSEMGESEHSNVLVIRPGLEVKDDERKSSQTKPVAHADPPGAEAPKMSARRRRSSAGSSGSPKSGTTPSDANSVPLGSTPSTPKQKSANHVQFDLSLPSQSENTPSSPSLKEKYSKTFPPTHQMGNTDSDRKHRRPTVLDQIKGSSKSVNLSRENSSDSLTNKPETDNAYPVSPKKGSNDDVRMSQEEIVRLALEKGLISNEEILRMALKMSKRKPSTDIQTPLKAFSNEDNQRLDDSLNDSTSSGKSSKIPVFKTKPFESSNESLDIPTGRERSYSSGSKPRIKESTKYDSTGRRVVRKTSQKKSEDHFLKSKRLDSSGSESCSPQVSPCNTSSGMSLGGTTGSESSGTDQARKHSSPEIQNYKRRVNRENNDTLSPTKPISSEKFAAARKISLTKPNPPPVPSVCSDTGPERQASKNEMDEQSDSSTTLTNSQSQNHDRQNAMDFDHCEQTALDKQQRHKSPTLTRKAQSKGFSPSFQDSRKVFLRREGSLDSMGSEKQSVPSGMKKVGSAPGNISGSDDVFQKVVQSDGSVVYRSYRKFSNDTPPDQLDHDQSHEVMNETFTVESPDAIVSPNVEPPEKDAEDIEEIVLDNEVKRKSSIDTRAVENDDDQTDSITNFRVLTDSDAEENNFRRHHRGRHSHRSPRRRSKERVKGRRSSSLSDVMRSLNNRKEKQATGGEKEVVKDLVKNKPPKPPTGRSPSTGEEGEGRKSQRKRTTSGGSVHCPSDSDDPTSATSRKPPRHRSRSRENQRGSRERSSDRGKRSRERSADRGSGGSGVGDLSSEGETSSAARNEKSSPSPRRKTFMKHQRSGSDLSNLVALPDRPESPSPRRPAPPSTPKKALTSPRVRRSSSFSRPGETKEKESQQPVFSNRSNVRQCISLETLKAVKSQSQELLNKVDDDAQTSDAEEEESEVSEEVRHHGVPATSAMRRSGSLRDDRLLYMSRYKNEFRNNDDDVSGSRLHMGVRDIHDGNGIGYSPRLSGHRRADNDNEPKQQRRIKLGTKAADLFAKLQMKLSNGKNRDSDNPGQGHES